METMNKEMKDLAEKVAAFGNYFFQTSNYSPCYYGDCGDEHSSICDEIREIESQLDGLHPRLALSVRERALRLFGCKNGGECRECPEYCVLWADSRGPRTFIR